MKYALSLFCLLGVVPAHAADAVPMLAYLEDEVDENSVQAVIDVIAKADEVDNRVILEINTDGGDVDAGFKLVKAIERAKKPVTCVVDGHAFSMGSFIFEACGRRVMTKRSILMIHQAGMQTSGHEVDFLDAAAEVAALSRALFEHYAHRIPGLSVPDMVAKTAGGRCIWLDWSEAKRLQAVDAIVNTASDVK